MREENGNQIAVCIIQDSWVACDRNSIQINLPKGKYIGLCNLPDRSGGEDFTRINLSWLTVGIWGIHGASGVLEGIWAELGVGLSRQGQDFHETLEEISFEIVVYSVSVSAKQLAGGKGLY